MYWYSVLNKHKWKIKKCLFLDTKSYHEVGFCFLEEFQLLSRSIYLLVFLSVKKFYIAKLLICYAQNSYLTVFR